MKRVIGMINKRGFTLVELIAVISLLGLLMVVAATSVSKTLTESKNKLLEEQVKSLKDTAITYVTNKKYYFKVCPDTFNPEKITDKDKNCYRKVLVSELVLDGLFENKKDICKGNKEIVVYRKKSGSYDSLETYLESDTCEY